MMRAWGAGRRRSGRSLRVLRAVAIEIRAASLLNRNGQIDARRLTEDELHALIQCEIHRGESWPHLIEEDMPKRGQAGWLAWEIVKT